jgi:hypothetical protein
MPNSDDKSLMYWRGMHALLDDAAARLPYADDPRPISWSHPDDDWKNDAELEAKEGDCWNDTNALITVFCTEQQWPRRSKNAARFFVRRRIDWAIGLIRVLSVPWSDSQRSAVLRPVESGWEFCYGFSSMLTLPEILRDRSQ